jgi:hypothetical protein
MEKKVEKIELKKRLYFRYTENSDSVNIIISKNITQKDIDTMADDPKYANKTIEFDVNKEIMKETSLPVSKTKNYGNFGHIIQFDISEDMIQEWFNQLDKE